MPYTINDWLSEHAYVTVKVRDPAVADEQAPGAYVEVLLPFDTEALATSLVSYLEGFRTFPQNGMRDFLYRLAEWREQQRKAGGDA